MYGSTPAVAKIGRFSWEIQYVENETFAYSALQKHAPHIIPKFLGPSTESGRVVGLLLEKIEGDFASIGDLSQCEEAVRAVHQAGRLQGDVNRYNSIVDRETVTVKLMDFLRINGASVSRTPLGTNT
jgi:hypothetical protein